MQLHTREHEELIQLFEANIGSVPGLHLRVGASKFSKEPKDMWGKGVIYQDGALNAAFLIYRSGYALGRAVYLNND